MIHAGLYHLFSRILFIEGSRTAEYTGALLIAAVYNFTLHRLWTFQLNYYSHAMLLRYITVVLTSMASQSVVFYIGHEVFGIYDYYVFVIATVFAAGIQYLGHRFVTFKK